MFIRETYIQALGFAYAHMNVLMDRTHQVCCARREETKAAVGAEGLGLW